ncbi:MAG: A24 family peptidase [Muribaculaceae bacterium]|nr:A24 family peptidase [Muribaculaceae bacterium]
MTDFKYDKIYNWQIVSGIFAGLYFRIREGGYGSVFTAIAVMLLSFCLLYPIYKIGGLGAGDVKLFLMISSFFPSRRMLYVAAVSFAIGAIFSLGKLILEKNGRERLQYLGSYLADVFRSRKWKVYGADLKEDLQRYKSNKIHFALPVSISVMLGLGGIF